MHLHFYAQLDWYIPETRNHLLHRWLNPHRISPRYLSYVASLLSPLLVAYFFDFLVALYVELQFSLRRVPGLGTLVLGPVTWAQLACLKLFGELTSH